MSDQIEAVGQQVTGVAEVAATQARKQGRKLQKKTLELQKLAAERGLELGDEAKKRGAAAVAAAPGVAAVAGKKARKKSSQVLEVAREKSGEALLSALDTDAGKLFAGTPAGTMLKSKLTPRRRRRRRLVMLLALNAGGAVAFQQLRSRRAPGAAQLPIITPAAAGKPTPAPSAVEEAVTEKPQLDQESGDTAG